MADDRILRLSGEVDWDAAISESNAMCANEVVIEGNLWLDDLRGFDGTEPSESAAFLRPRGGLRCVRVSGSVFVGAGRRLSGAEGASPVVSAVQGGSGGGAGPSRGSSPTTRQQSRSWVHRQDVFRTGAQSRRAPQDAVEVVKVWAQGQGPLAIRDRRFTKNLYRWVHARHFEARFQLPLSLIAEMDTVDTDTMNFSSFFAVALRLPRRRKVGKLVLREETHHFSQDCHLTKLEDLVEYFGEVELRFVSVDWCVAAMHRLIRRSTADVASRGQITAAPRRLPDRVRLEWRCPFFGPNKASLGVSEDVLRDELRKLRSVCDPVVVDEVNWLAVEVKYGPLPIPAEDTAPVNFQRGSLGEHVLDYKPKRRQLDFHVEGLRRVFDEWSSAFGETHKRCVNWAPVFTPVPSRATFFEAKWGYSRDAADGVGVPKMAFPGREKATGRPPLTKTLEWRDKVGHAGFSIL